MERSRTTSVDFDLAPPGHLAPFAAALTCRTGGCSAPPYDTLNLGRSTADRETDVRENEARVLRALDLPDRVARLRLEHGARILEAQGPGMFGPADAILSSDPDLVLWITVADCYPVVLAGPGTRIVGHCGWRGTAAGLVEAMVEALRGATGLAPSALKAWIGPGIGPCCYTVGSEVAERFSAGSVRTQGGDGTFALDLRAEICRRLEGSGLVPEAVASSGRCTACDAGRFFSHRAQGGRTGRMAALSWLARQQ